MYGVELLLPRSPVGSKKDIYFDKIFDLTAGVYFNLDSIPQLESIFIFYSIIKIKIHSSCEIEDFVETHLCKLCVILRSRALRVVCPH